MSAKGIEVYHGGRRFYGDIELQPRPSSKLQSGPGFYTTTNLLTAQKYAKGGGIVYRITLSPETRFGSDQKIPLIDALAWVDSRYGMRKKKEIVSDLESCSVRYQSKFGVGFVDQFSLMNLCVNYEVLSGEHGPSLARWMVEHGVDAEIQSAMKNNEQWVLIFNPAVVINKEALSMSDRHEYELPKIEEQLAMLGDHSVSNDSAARKKNKPMRIGR